MATPILYLSPLDIEVTAQHLALRFFEGYSGELRSYRANLARPEALESALGLTQMHYYPGVFEKAGALLRSMVKNHPYVDGNKRLGVTAAFLFLLFNGQVLVARKDELVGFAEELAASAMEWEQVAHWLQSHSQRLDSLLDTDWLDVERFSTLGQLLGEVVEGLDAATAELTSPPQETDADAPGM